MILFIIILHLIIQITFLVLNKGGSCKKKNDNNIFCLLIFNMNIMKNVIIICLVFKSKSILNTSLIKSKYIIKLTLT